jgi:hypothetical protein
VALGHRRGGRRGRAGGEEAVGAGLEDEVHRREPDRRAGGQRDQREEEAPPEGQPAGEEDVRERSRGSIHAETTSFRGDLTFSLRRRIGSRAMKGQRTAIGTGAIGLAVVLAAAIVEKDRLREEWYLRRLESDDRGIFLDAVGHLGEMKSRRAADRLKARGDWESLLTVRGLGWETRGHASAGIEIFGLSCAEVEDLFGPPKAKVSRDFPKPMYENQALPVFDELWTYLGLLTHLFVYFQEGKVVLALHEWSDL